MFSADSVQVKEASKSKYQQAGVSEKVTITEVILTVNEQWGSKNLTLNTINEDGQTGQSKRLSLKTEKSEGAQMSAWDVSAKYLVNVITSTTGMSVDEAKAVLKADSVEALVKQISDAIVGKSARGLFSRRVYNAEGKYAVELYRMEPIGGTYLKYDPANKYLNVPFSGAASATPAEGTKAPGDDLPF
jgi:hypothetical protein